ncbi:MAG: hypothetical protein ACREQI_11005 [Candidatus Binataceae bacterium]
MSPTSKHFPRLSLAAALLTIAFTASASFAQNPASNAQLIATAKKLYAAIATGNVATVRALSERKVLHTISKDSLSLPATGPKLKITFDGKVEVLRSDGEYAVTAANFYTPRDADVPAAEVSQLRIFFEKKGGRWVAAAPDRKEAMGDATLAGGWYHHGAFTFCPNRGIVYLPNHFSNKFHCGAVVACERF